MSVILTGKPVFVFHRVPGTRYRPEYDVELGGRIIGRVKRQTDSWEVIDGLPERVMGRIVNSYANRSTAARVLARCQ